MTEDNPYRIPRVVVPSHYSLTVTPDLDAETFSGTVTIEGEAAQSFSELFLHSIDLAITKATVTDSTGATYPAQATELASEEQIKLILESTAQSGATKVEVEFNGSLGNHLAGFYKSTFTDESGAEQIIASTQFEPTDARRAFPCYDEPDLKATFDITLRIADGLTAVSNASEISSTLDGGIREVKFARTMKMSTYLVAWVVGPLVASETVDVDGVPLRVLHIPGREALAEFALECGAHSLRFFRKYFDIPYPGDKLDMVGIPDFAFGAMENLGCVTYRETALLVDKKNASRVDLERIADVVAHEIAHMWFGDLVTMKWWDGIWLNEAFATFMELLAVDAQRPEWKRWTSFSLSRASAMGTDGLHATRPIEYPVVHPNDANGMFDILTYQKGAAVLRMLEQYIGPEPFRRGISSYLKQHSYGNTQTTDLWDAIEAESGEPVRAMMDSWILQGGHPVVSVKASADATSIELSQKRFLYLPDDSDQAIWQVPVHVRASTNSGEVDKKVLLNSPETVAFDEKINWAVVNTDSRGFYRVRYDSDLLQALSPVIQSELTELERFGLVSDTWASVRAANSPLTDFVELARSFKDEMDPDVWSAIVAPIGYITRIGNEEANVAIASYMRSLATPAFEKVGWQATSEEDDRIGALRSALIGALAITGQDENVQARCRELVDEFLNNGVAISSDIANAVVSAAAWRGDEELFNQYRKAAKNAKTPQEETRFLWSLASFGNQDVLQKTLEVAITDEVKIQNAPYLVGSVLGNRLGGQLGWEFVSKKWKTVTDRFPASTHSRMVEYLGTQAIPGLADEVESFFAANPIAQGGKTVDQTVESMRVNEAFRARVESDLVSIFS